MKKTLLSLCFLATALSARADLVITLQTVTARFDPQTIVIKTKGDKFRADISRNSSSISDLVTGDAIIINHQSKTYWKISGLHIKSSSASPTAENYTSPKASVQQPAQLVDTGKSEKIGDYSAEIYTAQTANEAYTYWVTRDYPDYATISETLKKIQQSGATVDKNASTPDLSKLDGLVLKFQMLSAGGRSSTTTLVSAKIQPVDEAEFHVPDGYTEVTQ